MAPKTIFISYSWDNEDHKEWVLNLANNLVKNGIDVILDQYDLSAGQEMTYFMEKAMTSDKIVMIMTPNYKLKADKRSGGVGFEYSLITKDYYDKEPNKLRIIPLLRKGNQEKSCPTYIQTKIFHDMRDDLKFDSKFYELIKLIIDKPLVNKPQLGKLPNFDNNLTPDIDKAIVDLQKKEEFSRTKELILNSEKGTKLFVTSTKDIIKQISESIENYQKNFNFIIFKETDNNKIITFSTGNYTFRFESRSHYFNSASDSIIKLNFYKGLVGFENRMIDVKEKPTVIYFSEYKFDLDENFSPIFIKSDNTNVIFTSNEIAKIAIREVIMNEIKYRESKL